MKHPCRASGCWRQVQNADFMCGQHWFQLPLHMRGALWNGHVPGVELGRDQITGEMRPAALEAIAYIERRSA